MATADISLLTKRRFAPLFGVQFLGAFNDNLLKFALLFLANFGVAALAPRDAEMLATIATGIFTLPYFLFSAMAGQVADRFDKARLIRIIKAGEVLFMLIALLGFALGSIPILMFTLFCMGLQSTFFGPVKYSILPQHLGTNEVMGGTGVIQAGTFLAILGGQLLAGLITPLQAGMLATGLAVLGFLSALMVPKAPPSGTEHPVEMNVWTGTMHVLARAKSVRGAWLAILGISWFFAAGAVLLAQFAPLVSGPFGAQQEVVTLLLLVFSTSVAIGSMGINRVLGGQISARFVPITALVLALSLIALWFVGESFTIRDAEAGISEFLDNPASISVLVVLALIGISGGMFIVPLYAILQTATPADQRSRMIAANNIMNAGITVLVVAVAAALQASGVRVTGLIGILGAATLIVALFSCWLLPETVIKALVKGVLKFLYRVKVHGRDNMVEPGTGAVVVVNHVSWLDGLLLAAFLPGKPTFAINTHVAQKWWVKPALKLFDAFPVDPTNPMAAKAMIKAVREGRTLVIFPEGRITTTGALMKVFDGPGMVADKAGAPLIPVRISGAQFSKLSKLKDKVRRRWFPQIELTVLPPRRFEIEGELSARQRRAIAGRRLYDEMSAMVFETSDTGMTLFGALTQARAIHGRKTAVVEDVQRQPLTYDRLIAGSMALGREFSRVTEKGEAVGLLLPNISGVVAAFFALQAEGRVPAMLNFTAGLTNMKAACTAAQVKTVVTARAFVDQAKLGEVIAGLQDDGLTIVYLEDIRERLTGWDRLRAFWRGLRAERVHAKLQLGADDPAVILFTSGSEGLPKGVVLSHRNLLSNCQQIASRIAFNSNDIVMNALPVFHSFGLTGGTLLPMLNGIKTVLYPSPLHYRQVPAFAYDANATILFGTDTFLSGYAHMAHPYDFYSMRYVFAGAEKVRDETRTTWMDKFGLRILEGYGATECSPVIAVNTPMHFRAGTVGRALPDMELRLEEIPGIEEGGRLAVRGPNVMLGYFKADAPGVLQPPEDGWHDTGDIVTLDEEGFITIRGRAKRFAKIGGEMVSLPAVEGYAAQLWPDAEHAVVTRPDPRKGEQLVLFTTQAGASAKPLQEWGRANGISELMIPRDIRVLEEMPVLGTGKRDYVALGKLANPE